MNDKEALQIVRNLAVAEKTRLHDEFKQVLREGNSVRSAPVARIALETANANKVIEWCYRMLENA